MPFTFENDFKETARAIETGARRVERTTAEKALKRAKDKAPVKTGALRDSGRVVETPQGIEVVFDVPYAESVENGFFDAAGGKAGGGAFRAGAHFLANGLAASREDMDDVGEKMLRDLV